MYVNTIHARLTDVFCLFSCYLLGNDIDVRTNAMLWRLIAGQMTKKCLLCFREHCYQRYER